MSKKGKSRVKTLSFPFSTFIYSDCVIKSKIDVLQDDHYFIDRLNDHEMLYSEERRSRIFKSILSISLSS